MDALRAKVYELEAIMPAITAVEKTIADGRWNEGKQILVYLDEMVADTFCGRPSEDVLERIVSLHERIFLATRRRSVRPQPALDY